MKLSGSQERVLELANKGLTVAQIASRLHTTKGVVAAQMTRIRNKGVKIPGASLSNVFTEADASKADDALVGQVNSALAQAAKIGEKAVINKADLPDLEHRLRSAPGAEHYMKLGIHPFLLFDVVVKFTKMLGGREAAHQAIEDVFESIRGFLGVKDPNREDREG